MEPESSDRIPWERQYYGDIKIPHCPSKTIKCKMCGTPFLDTITEIPYLISHLYIEHHKTELTDHPEREFLLQKFSINEKNSEAKCVCERVIVYDMYGLYLLKNHVEIYHGNSSHIYEIIAKTESGRDTLDKYIIMGSEATCPKCELKIDMIHSETQVVEKVKELLEHYFSHRYKEKCYICYNARKFDFVLFVLFQFHNNSIFLRCYDWIQFFQLKL